MAFTRALLIGNTRWHWAERDGDVWQMDHTAPQPERLAGSPLLWAAVGAVPPQLIGAPHRRLTLADVALADAPPWLGIDRALAAVAAWRLSTTMGCICDRGVLVADAGTVLSLTLVNGSGQFVGGQLVPGLQLQLTAMGQGTVALPTVHGAEASCFDRFPSETAAAMQQGVAAALVGVVRQAFEETGALLWISGGDAPVLAQGLKHQAIPFRHDPDLVLKGLVSRP